MRRSFLLLTLLASLGCAKSPTASSDFLRAVAPKLAEPLTRLGQTTTLTATAIYASGREVDVTAEATFAGFPDDVVRVEGRKVTLVGEGFGSGEISATYQTVRGQVPLRILIPWDLTGHVISNPTGAPVAGATVSVAGLPPLAADASGGFAIADHGTTDRKIDLSASGMLSRTTYLRVGESRDVAIDMITLGNGFSLDFYRQLVRNNYASGALLPLRRWETSPSFYVKTTDDRGETIAPDVLGLLREFITGAISEWTAGQLHLAAFESGSDTRPAQAGWINLSFVHQSGICGSASVGGSSGILELNPDCGCASYTFRDMGQVVAHEVGHAMGFWHVSSGTLSAVSGCGTTAGISSREKYHAAIAYSRPVGNLDPDIDPPGFTNLLARSGSGPKISCALTLPR